MPPWWNQRRWGGAQAGASLTLASNSRLLSGMTTSPLINGLLPATTTLPAHLPLRRRSTGFGLQLASALVMICLCVAAIAGFSTRRPWGMATLLLAALMMTLGQDLSRLPLQRDVLRSGGLEFRQLRRGSELCVVVGSLLTGLIVCHARPGWLATFLFIPVAWLAACCDLQQVERITDDDPAAGWQILQRSGAIGGLVGIPLMGGFARLLGLPFALPLNLGLFCLAPLLLRSRLQRS